MKNNYKNADTAIREAVRNLEVSGVHYGEKEYTIICAESEVDAVFRNVIEQMAMFHLRRGFEYDIDEADGKITIEVY